MPPPRKLDSKARARQERWRKAFARTSASRARAEQNWRDAIVGAHMDGLSQRTIAQLAKISHQRVHQLIAESQEGADHE